MLNFSRNDRPDPLKDPKLAQRPATPAIPATPPAATPPRSSAPATSEPPAATASAAPASLSDNAGSRLSIGPNINLKGVEISNCDVLAIEGNVEATIISKVMEIAPPGRLNGTATIDIAEVHGEFSGELTVRDKLTVHGTGRVTGTVRYGRLVVADGGVINGEIKQLEPAAKATPSPATSSPPRAPLAPQPH